MSYPYAKELIRRDVTNLLKHKGFEDEDIVTIICNIVEEALIEAEVITDVDE